MIRWLRRKQPRLTWKRIRRRYWGHNWTGPNGARLAWPDEVPVESRMRGNVPVRFGGRGGETDRR